MVEKIIRKDGKVKVEYTIATGRRKTSIAVVKLVKGKGRIFVNGKTLKDYIGNMPAVEMLVYRPLVLTDNAERYDVKVKAVGGGIVSQCGAMKHGISRALVKINEDYKNVLRQEGLLTRDPRVKERKKYGRKKARKRFQFSKR
jgi:small subunit ribosomal protein S9